MKPLKILIVLAAIVVLAVNNIYSQGYLHCTGKYIYDSSGNEVILRGIGTGNWMLQEGYMMQTSDIAGTMHEFRTRLESAIGKEKTDSFYNVWLASYFRPVDADSLRSWGFNSLRVVMQYKWFTLPIEEEQVLGQNTWLDKGFTILDSLLDWCGNNRIYLILDLHAAPGGQGKDANISDYDPSKPSLWESQYNKEKTIALWRKLAERYSDEPWIGGYDLINETNWTFPEGNNSKLKELMVNITNAIREVDTNHIIFVEGNSFANDYTGLTPPWDDNMAYSFHKYGNYYTQESINFVLNIRNTYNIPVWLGESGENSNTWFTGCIALCEKNHIGWSWWPFKKAGLNNPLKVTVNEDYTQLVNYWKGTDDNPGVDAAFTAVLQFAKNQCLENCTFQRDVVDAMIRQPQTYETVPWRVCHIGEPVFGTEYNLGRSGYAYLDNDSANFSGSTGVYTSWNQGWNYRNDGVDIEPCTDADTSNGYNVGWTANGEWMEYTVVVDSTAGYTLAIRSASASAGCKVHLEVNGLAVTQLINLPGTGGWQTWRTTESDGVMLTKGTQKIRFVFDQGGSNLNFFKFTDPVAVDSLSFINLYAASSDDGLSILLTLNKPVTSSLSEVSPADFSVRCGSDPVTVSAVSAGTNSENTILLSLADSLYYGGSIYLSYQGNNIFSGSQALGEFNNIAVKSNLPVRFTLPVKIEAENFSFNNGLVSESCTDAGGGSDMGYAAPGDYLDYRIYVPQSKYYTINFRIATIRASSQLIVRVGEGSTFTDIGTLNISSTGGWQTWKTMPVTVFLYQGRYTLRLYVKSGEFNTNWFQFISASGVGIDTENKKDVQLYPNPARDFITVDLTGLNGSARQIIIYNMLGQPVKNILPLSSDGIRIGISDLDKGLYYLVVNCNNSMPVISKFLIQ